VSTQWSIAATTSSVSVPSVNQTGEAMFGRAFRVVTQYGWAADVPQVVLNASSSVTVHAHVMHPETSAPLG
jgi:hypothetical protein